MCIMLIFSKFRIKINIALDELSRFIVFLGLTGKIVQGRISK